MLRTIITAAASAAFLALSPATFAQDGQSGEEARAMLERAVEAVKTDKDAAIDMFKKGVGGFLDRDLYPFCFMMTDGAILATQAKQLIGQDVRTIKDQAGKTFGQELYDSAKEGEINEVRYMFPRPGDDQALVLKISYVTRIGDIGCEVGYYE